MSQPTADWHPALKKNRGGRYAPDKNAIHFPGKRDSIASDAESVVGGNFTFHTNLGFDSSEPMDTFAPGNGVSYSISKEPDSGIESKYTSQTNQGFDSSEPTGSSNTVFTISKELDNENITNEKAENDYVSSSL